MSDIALIPSTGRFDVELAGADLQPDDGLRTAVLLSLFSDRRAAADDALPDGGEDRRGWWADAWPPAPGDAFGSRLWLLAREKQTDATLERAREYAREALQWLVDDGVAERVDVTARWEAPGRLGMVIEIVRPTGAGRVRYETVWTGEIHAV